MATSDALLDSYETLGRWPTIAGGDGTEDEPGAGGEGDVEDNADDDLEEDGDELEDDDGDVEGGGTEAAGDAKPEEQVAPVVPTGKDLLDLLASDTDAQVLMRTAMENLQRNQEAEATAEAERRELAELVDKGDYAEVGKRIVERSRTTQARSEVADAVLREQFTPAYTKILGLPEMQSLTVEEKEKLLPRNFGTDAEYLGALHEFVAGKRHEKTIEAEVERRVAERLEHRTNTETGNKVRKASVAATPAASGESLGKRSSSDLLKHGLRSMFNPSANEDDDD